MVSPNQSGSGPATILRGAYLTILVLFVTNLFNYIDRQNMAAVLPKVKEEFLSNPDSLGPISQFLVKWLGFLMHGTADNMLLSLLPMVFLLVYMLAAPVLSNLKVRPWKIIGFGVIIWSLASGFSGLAQNFDQLLLSRMFIGIGEAAFGPFAAALLSEYFPEKHRGKALSFFYMAIPVGSALGYVWGGHFADSELGWRYAFYTTVPPGVLLGTICLFMRDPPRYSRLALNESSGESRFSIYRQLLSNKSFVYNTLAMTAMTFAIGGIAFWMPTYIHEYRQVGTLASVNLILGGILVVSGLVATIAGGFIADALRHRVKGAYFSVSGWAMYIAAPCCVAFVYLPFPLAWGLLFAACFCLFLNTGPSNTALANVVLPKHRPAAFALNILIIHLLGDVLSPLAIGSITDSTGSMNNAMLMLAAMVLLGGFIWRLGAKHLDRDTALVSKSE